MYQFAVITQVPAPGEMGNLACPMGSVLFESQQPSESNNYRGEYIGLGVALGNPMLELLIRSPVFTLGEILVLNEDGREAVGAGRKPDKWDVSYETFSTIEEAVTRAHEVN